MKAEVKVSANGWTKKQLHVQITYIILAFCTCDQPNMKMVGMRISFMECKNSFGCGWDGWLCIQIKISKFLIQHGNKTRTLTQNNVFLNGQCFRSEMYLGKQKNNFFIWKSKT